MACFSKPVVSHRVSTSVNSSLSKAMFAPVSHAEECTHCHTCDGGRLPFGRYSSDHISFLNLVEQLRSLKDKIGDISRVVVLYHGLCLDGETSLHILEENLPVKASYGVKAGGYLSRLEMRGIMSLKDKPSHIICVDVVVPMEQIKTFLDKGIKVVVLDHHISNVEEYSSFQHPLYFPYFNVEYAGCVLAYAFVHNGKALPYWLTLISESDLGNKQRLLDADKLSYSMFFIREQCLAKNRKFFDSMRLFSGLKTLPRSFSEILPFLIDKGDSFADWNIIEFIYSIINPVKRFFALLVLDVSLTFGNVIMLSKTLNVKYAITHFQKFVLPVFEQTGMLLTAEKIQLVLSAAKKGIINNFAVVNDISRLYPRKCIIAYASIFQSVKDKGGNRSQFQATSFSLRGPGSLGFVNAVKKAFPSDNIISGGGHKQACGLKIMVNSSETALTLEKKLSSFVGFCLSLKFKVIYGLPGTYNEKENFVFPLVTSTTISDLSSHVIETVKKNGTKVSTTYIPGFLPIGC